MPYELKLKHELVRGIYLSSSPGNYINLNAAKLRAYTYRNIGAAGVVICTSARLKGLCTSKELISLGEGGTVICVVRITGSSKAR